MVVKPGREHEVEAIFEKWDLHAVKIGVVTDGSQLRVRERRHAGRRHPESRAHRRSARLPPPDERPGMARRGAAARSGVADSRRAAPPTRCGTLLASPTIASKRWIYRQYDHMVRTNTIVLPGLGCGVVRVKGTSARAGDVGGRPGPLRPARSAPGRAAGRGRERRATSPAPARCRLRRPTTSTSATRRSPRSCGSSPRPSPASARPAARSRRPSPAATSASTTRPTARPSCPTPVLGIVGVIEDASKVLTRTFKRAGTPVVLLGTTQRRAGRVGVPLPAARADPRAGAGAGPRRREAAAAAAGRCRRRRPAALRARLLRGRARRHAGGVLLRHRRHRRSGECTAALESSVLEPSVTSRDRALFLRVRVARGRLDVAGGPRVVPRTGPRPPACQPASSDAPAAAGSRSRVGWRRRRSIVPV